VGMTVMVASVLNHILSTAVSFLLSGHKAALVLRPTRAPSHARQGSGESVSKPHSLTNYCLVGTSSLVSLDGGAPTFCYCIGAIPCFTGPRHRGPFFAHFKTTSPLISREQTRTLEFSLRTLACAVSRRYLRNGRVQLNRPPTHALARNFNKY